MTQIVVVDDSAETLTFLQDLFQDRGWNVVPCRDQAAAFDLVLTAKPDLVFLDLWLDTPDAGWQILQQLKEDPGTRSIPVVVCSAYNDVLRDHESLLEKDAAAVLVKPFDVDDAYRCVEYVLSSHAKN